MGPTVVPLLVYGPPCINTVYPRFWVVSEGPVSRNPPAWCHAPILTPLHPHLSLQQPPRTSTHHLPYITMPHRRFGANGTTTYTVPMTHLPLPFPSLFLTLWLPGSWGMHVPISPDVSTMLLCINMIYLTAFWHPSKQFLFNSNINTDCDLTEGIGPGKANYIDKRVYNICTIKFYKRN